MPRLRSWRAVSPRWRGLFNNISASPRSLTSSIRARSTGLPQTYEGVGPQFAAAAGLFHLRRVVDEMDLRIRSFEHQVIAPRLFVLAVNEHPALDGSDLRQIEHFDRQGARLTSELRAPRASSAGRRFAASPGEPVRNPGALARCSAPSILPGPSARSTARRAASCRVRDARRLAQTSLHRIPR